MSEQSTHTSPGATTKLRRELKARHLTMIAIGGSIDTGLFVASGATVAQAGPGGALFYWFNGLFFDDQFRRACGLFTRFWLFFYL